MGKIAGVGGRQMRQRSVGGNCSNIAKSLSKDIGEESPIGTGKK
jgi:hypothetical protein